MPDWSTSASARSHSQKAGPMTNRMVGKTLRGRTARATPNPRLAERHNFANPTHLPFRANAGLNAARAFAQIFARLAAMLAHSSTKAAALCKPCGPVL
eukprot:9473540-Pyramimonas_sp.AAC.1